LLSNLAKVEVAGTNPVSRSKKYTGQVKYLALILWCARHGAWRVDMAKIIYEKHNDVVIL
jgi:hypothetical protein